MDSNIINNIIDTDDIEEFNWYIQLRTEAQKKGIDVLACVNKLYDEASEINNWKYRYAVVKDICGLLYDIEEDGELYLHYSHDDPLYHYNCYCYSLREAGKIVENFNENIIQMPKFYGFIRQYDGEPNEILDYQAIALNYFAEKYGIKYETIFGCKGGYAEQQGRKGYIDVTHSCEKFFSEMDKNRSILCVVDWGRLDGDYFDFDWAFSRLILDVGNVPYNHDNIIEYQEYKPEDKNECIPEKKPEQEYYIPEYEHNSIPGDIPEYILRQEYDYAPDHMQEYDPTYNAL